MDKVSFVKSRLKLEHWKRLIAECQASGLPVKQWCSNNDDGGTESNRYDELGRTYE